MGKAKSFGKHARKKAAEATERRKKELLFKEDGQEYATASKMLGNHRLEVCCNDGVTRMCTIRGAQRKRAWISVGDLLLVGLRDYQDAKCDSIAVYTTTEASMLRRYGELQGLRDVEEQDDDVVFEHTMEDINVASI